MKKFITLTMDDSSNTQVIVNSSAIQYFFRSDNYTKVVFSSDGDNSRLLVKNTPEEILDLINDSNTGGAPSGNLGEALRGGFLK